MIADEVNPDEPPVVGPRDDPANFASHRDLLPVRKERHTPGTLNGGQRADHRLLEVTMANRPQVRPHVSADSVPTDLAHNLYTERDRSSGLPVLMSVPPILKGDWVFEIGKDDLWSWPDG